MTESGLMHRIPRTRGVTKIEVIIAIIAIAIVIVILIVVLRGPRMTAQQAQNTRYLKWISSAMMIFASDSDGLLPRPGLIDRLPFDPDDDGPLPAQDVRGQGAEDVSANTTANLFSLLIAQEYFGPDILISPLERNPNVVEYDDYNYDAYDPDADVYWDPEFVADLDVRCNVSYGHLPIWGEPARKWWRSTAHIGPPLLGNRGPADGIASADSLSCQPDGRWLGAMTPGADEALRALSIPAGASVRWKDLATGDNPFDYDAAVSDPDVVIAITKEITEDGPVLQHD
jgi:type II secretory pathway pseudopilin PulG